MNKENKKHILIVEDSLDLQDLLSELFLAEGYRFSRALNGRVALDMLQTMPELPTVILLDLMMPVMDGLEFRRLQKMDSRISDIPVVVMTADASFEKTGIYLDLNAVVSKPIKDIDQLVLTVKKVQKIGA